MSYLRMENLELSGQRVMIREDLNVPISDGQVTSDARIRAVLPTLHMALEKGAAILLLSHLGRPIEGEFDAQFSLRPVASCLEELLGRTVRFESHWLDGVDVAAGEVVLCENVRFNRGEKDNDACLAQTMADLCDVFVMDAFGTAHRAQASTEGVVRAASLACAGPLLSRELDALKKSLYDPVRPMLAIVGGSKVSTKLKVLDTLLDRVDELIVGGGIANTFIAASGYDVGQSLYEPDLIHNAQGLIQKAHAQGGSIPIPQDVLVAKSFSPDAKPQVRSVDEVAADEMILDIGPLTAVDYSEVIAGSGTVIWNGPVGVFEFPHFAAGTRAIAEAIERSSAFSIAGGGDTLAAIDQFGVKEGLSYISTGGGAFLEFVEGKPLPAVVALQEVAGD